MYSSMHGAGIRRSPPIWTDSTSPVMTKRYIDVRPMPSRRAASSTGGDHARAAGIFSLLTFARAVRHQRGPVAQHLAGGRGRERARDHRDPPQQGALGLGQQGVAPVERRAQRPVPVVEAGPAREEVEPVGLRLS